jgi:DNA-binding LacI/PurR family transcriptional regulator
VWIVLIVKPSLNARGTMIDIARLLGVSSATVSNAFNRPDQLFAKLREKILATARSLNYSGPNPADRMLRTGFSGTIAVIYPDSLLRPFENPVVASLLGGIADACAERGLALFLQQGGNSLSRLFGMQPWTV